MTLSTTDSNRIVLSNGILACWIRVLDTAIVVDISRCQDKFVLASTDKLTT